jgi:hypothetical protein
MRKIREALRLKASGLSYRAIARVCLIGKETVREYLGRAAEVGLTWPLPEGIFEEELERRLFPDALDTSRKEAEPDWALVHRELRKKGVTRQLLWEEYRLGTPRGYHYSQFCQRYRWWKKVLTPVLRMEHKVYIPVSPEYTTTPPFLLIPSSSSARAAASRPPGTPDAPSPEGTFGEDTSFCPTPPGRPALEPDSASASATTMTRRIQNRSLILAIIASSPAGSAV